jgi:erythromycin esterase
VREFSIGPPSEADLSDAFAAAGSQVAWLLLRGVTDPHARTWMDAAQYMQSVGDGFSSPSGARERIRVGPAFDAVVYVDSVTRAKPIRAPSTRPR